jgi:AcrR family transcriptional regulator
LSKEDRRVIKTKRAISAAFQQLLKDRDFKDISVNDVTALAGISRTTFYHHYADKYDWLETTICDALAQYTVGTHITDLQDRELVVRNLIHMFRSIANDPPLCTLIQANENHQLIYKFFLNTMTTQFQEMYGPFAKLSPKESLTTHYIAASLSAFIEWWVRNTTLFTPEQLVNCIESFHKLP